MLMILLRCGIFDKLCDIAVADEGGGTEIQNRADGNRLAAYRIGFLRDDRVTVDGDIDAEQIVKGTVNQLS